MNPPDPYPVHTFELQVMALPGGRLPTRGTENAAALDFYLPTDPKRLPGKLYPGESMLLPLGVAVAVPSNMVLVLAIRSGLANKWNLTLQNGVGVIDPDYRGELGAIVRNEGTSIYHIEPGTRIVQGLFLPCPVPTVREVSDLPPTARGAGGFGSSGTN